MTTFFSGKDLPNNVKRMLNTYGDEEITNIIIARRPLSTGTKILLTLLGKSLPLKNVVIIYKCQIKI